MSKDSRKLAMEIWTKALQSCKTKQEISEFCQQTCTMSIMTIHGIEGAQFKLEFLSAAMASNEMIKPEVQH